MNIAGLVNNVRNTVGCVVYPPAGLPSIDKKHTLPNDVGEFYKLCGGATLFGEGDFLIEIVAPQYVALANPVLYLGSCLPKEQLDNMKDHISWSWYIIADLCDRNFVTIDLSTERLGRCYDSSWDVHPYDSEIIATSFTDYLIQCLATQGQTVRYWTKPRFKRLGGAND